MPHQPTWPRTLALSLAIVVLVAGGVGVVSCGETHTRRAMLIAASSNRGASGCSKS